MATAVAARVTALMAMLEERYPLRELRALLEKADIKVPGSWAKATEKLTQLTGSGLSHAATVLQDICSDLVLAGTKDVFIFELDEAEVEEIGDAFSSIILEDNAYSTSYPLSISETALAAQADEHLLAKKVQHASGDISLVLCAKRSQEDRTVYQYSEVTQAVQQAFSGIDELITIRRLDYQIFDVVTLRKSLRRLEVLIDQPSRIRLPQTSSGRRQYVVGKLSTLAPSLSSIYEGDEPMNLYECISGLYHAANEGKVRQLSFRAPTGSVNKGMIAVDDLRHELFHEKGVEAVGDVTPYDITVTWETLTNAPGGASVQIGVPLASLSTTGGTAQHARLSGARSDAAVITVVNKLVSYSTG